MTSPSRFTAFYETHLRKRPQQSRSRSVVEAILVAALDKLSHGDDEGSITVQDVATRAGVGIGSLYDYFRDRQSLLAAAAAKVTEDNLRAFEGVLEDTKTMPLDEGVRTIVAFAIDTYTRDKRVPRALLRIAHTLNLMPTLAESQTIFTKSLADALRRRKDIHKDTDIDLSAWIMTQAMMGLVHTLIWQDEPTLSVDAMRDETVRMFVRHLRAA